MDQISILLSKLYRLRATVGQILSDDASMIFNLPGEAGDRSAREAALLRAVKSEIVRLRLKRDRPPNKVEFPRRVRIDSSSLPENAEVELTAKGGALWEKKARPAWDFFVDEAEPRVVRDEVWIFFEAKSRPWLTCVDQTFKRFGFFGKTENKIIALRGWHPVYWKRFSSGYSLAINTGHHVQSELGERFLQGLSAADERLSTTLSVFSGIWDARWVASLR